MCVLDGFPVVEHEEEILKWDPCVLIQGTQGAQYNISDLKK